MLIPKFVARLAKVCEKLGKKDLPTIASGVTFRRRRADKKCDAVATNGRSLVRVVWDDYGEDHEHPYAEDLNLDKKKGFAVVLPARAFVETMRRVPAKPKNESLKFLVLEEALVEGKARCFSADENGTRDERVDPIVGELLPDQSATPSIDRPGDRVINVNAELLANTLTALYHTACKSSPWRSVRLSIPDDPKKGIRIDAGSEENGVTAVAVVMPMSEEEIDKAHVEEERHREREEKRRAAREAKEKVEASGEPVGTTG